MTRKPKVNECPDHYSIAFEAIGILRPLNCGIDDTDEAQTVIQLVVDWPEEYSCVTATISKAEPVECNTASVGWRIGTQNASKVVFSPPEGTSRRSIPRYLDGPIWVCGSDHEKAIQVAYHCLVMARAVVPQGGEE